MPAKEGKKKKKPLHEYPDFERGTQLFSHVGMDSLRNHSIHVLDENIVLSCAANTLQFVNISTGSISCVPGPQDGGIGAVCVHPSRQFYTVCEKRLEKPLATIYEYPTKRQKAVLRNGAERGFSACRFNDSGNMLATVAIEPDFVLTIWNWEEESIILRNKAFGADVFNVAFNSFNDGLMVTSGSGHIKFWSMASTFTGLKLQGHVGKFGRTEISDIVAFASMADGKVVSGSEGGMLLLWEGNLIKTELGRAQPWDSAHPVGKCHEGAINVIELVEDRRIVMTGGEDGYLRYWALDEIDGAENTGAETPCAIKQLHEVLVGKNVKIRAVTRSVDGRHWIVLDSAGAIRKASYATYTAIMNSAADPGAAAQGDTVARGSLLAFNAGGVTAVAASPVDHTCLTGGEDCTVRLIDYISKAEVFQVRFDAQLVHLEYLASTADGTKGRVALATFDDGTVRLLRRARNTLEVLSQQRPHAEGIVAFAVDASCQQLWTLAKDRTAFYFNLTQGGTQLDPVGYCTLPERPLCSEFSHHGDRVFVGFPSGNIIALEAPGKAVDPAVGFLFDGVWEGVGYRQKMKPPVKEKKPIQDAFGVEQAESSDDDDLLAEEEDQGPWPVAFIRRLPHGAMAVGLTVPELCYEYNLSTRYPNNATGPPPLPPTGIEPAGRVEEPLRNLSYRDTVMTNAKMSQSKKTLMLITERSTVALRPCSKLEQVRHSAQLHDALDHRISDAAMSFDERVLLTVGLDGMLFAHSIAGLEPPTNAEAATHESLPTVEAQAVVPIPHCIQQQKELNDQHEAEEAALGKKERLLRKVREVHAKFNHLLDENDVAAGGRKIETDEMILDPEVLDLLEDQKAKSVRDAHLEYQWVSAKKETLMKKLQAAFVDTLQWERFELRGFANGITVASFRAPHLTDAQKERLERVQQALMGADADGVSGSGEGLRSSPSGSPASGPSGSPRSALAVSPRSPTVASLPGDGHADPSETPMSTRQHTELSRQHTSIAVKSQLEKAEERKRERIARKKGMQQLLARNPEHLPEDPSEVGAIERAANRMGNLKLKTDPDYAPDPHAQPTAPRKATQLILLESSITQLRSDFNQRVLDMRDVKRRLCESMNTDRHRIQQISEALGEEIAMPPFALVRAEEPEKRFEVDNERLEQFRLEAEKARKRAEQQERAKKGFGADLATMDEEEEDPAKRRQSTGAAAGAYAGAAVPPGPREKFEMDLRARQSALRRSDMEDEEWDMYREQLRYEKTRLERRIAKSVEAFDESLDDLYHEKLKLESDLCMADMRVLLLYREYLLLLDFRERDKQLHDRKELKDKEAAEAATLVQECERNVRAKEAIIRETEAKMETLKEEFDEMVLELKPGQLAELEGIYTRKIKRRRPDEDEDEDDDDSSSSDDEDEEEDDWAEEGDDQCPTSIDEDLFQAVLALREKRLDQVDCRNDVNKALDKLKQEHDRLQRRLQNANTHLRHVNDEVEEFKKEKQKQLNRLETIVVLKLSQIRCLDEDRKMPRVLSDEFVVFTQEGLHKLQQRIVDLGREREQLEVDMRQVESEASRLNRRKAKRVAEFQEWEAKVFEVQLLKFGQRVNLEMLENVAVDRETEELKAALKAEELRWERELAKHNRQLQDLKQQQQQRIAENTACLKDLGSFRAEQRDLEEGLRTSAGKIVAKMSGGSKVATAADRAHLKDLVVAQQQEIDALKNEIAMLRRKGGHVYTPVVNRVAPPQGPPTSGTM